MTARGLLADLRRRGIGVALEVGMDEEERIVLRGQALEHITDEDRRLIRSMKAALLPLLRWEASHGWGPWWPPAPLGPCGWCGGQRFVLSAALGDWRCVSCQPITTPPVAWMDAIAEEVTPAR